MTAFYASTVSLFSVLWKLVIKIQYIQHYASNSRYIYIYSLQEYRTLHVLHHHICAYNCPALHIRVTRISLLLVIKKTQVYVYTHCDMYIFTLVWGNKCQDWKMKQKKICVEQQCVFLGIIRNHIHIVYVWGLLSRVCNGFHLNKHTNVSKVMIYAI